MKTKIMMLVLFCTACTEKPRSTKETQKLLSQYTWAYTPPNSDIPIELSFEDNHFGAYTSCNGIGASYKIAEQKIVVQLPIVSTAMGCPPHLEKQESFIKGFFEHPVPFQIKYASSPHPKLIFQKNQQEYIFIGTKILSKNKHPHGE